MSSKFGGGGKKCEICGKTAYAGEQIHFEKKVYHPNCFKCAECGRKMGAHEAMLEKESGKLYDRRCYAKLGFAQKTVKVKWTKSTATTTTSSGSKKYGGGGKKCKICGKTVYPAEQVTFEKEIYHINCFRCLKCKKKISTSDCIKDENNLYCRKCAGVEGITRKQLSSTKTWKKSSGGGGGSSKFGGGGDPCVLCGKTVFSAEKVVYEKKSYHPKCFKCSVCGVALKNTTANDYEGKLFCKKHFDEGGYASKQAKVKWTKGKSTGGGGSGKYGGGGVKCYICAKTVYAGEKVTFEKRVYHQKCFKCCLCAMKINTSKANHFKLDNDGHAQKLGVEWEEKDGARDLVICNKCFGEKQVRTMQTSQKKWHAKAPGEKSSGTKDSRFKAFGGGGSKCKICSKTVYPAETVKFEGEVYHGKCFCCIECNKKLDVGKANYTKDNKGLTLYCEKCYYAGGHNRAKLNSNEEKSEEPATEEPATGEPATEQPAEEEPVRDTLD